METSSLSKIAYEQSRVTMDDSQKCLLAAFSYLGLPESLADVGCGEGHLVKLAASLGIPSVGIDSNLPEERDLFENGSLFKIDIVAAKLQNFWEPFESEMVLCWEVGEHLPPIASDTLCDILALITKKVLVFTSAAKNQGGAGHLNEQPQEYWRRKLEARGLTYDNKSSQELRAMWKMVATLAWWYPQNCQVFYANGSDDNG